jgi:uncharacterized coiled-coil DUF342 family protein
VIDEIRRSRLEDLVEWLSRCVGNPFGAEAEDLRLLLDASKPYLRSAEEMRKEREQLRDEREKWDGLEAERDTYKAQLDSCLTRIDQLKQEREALRGEAEQRKHKLTAYEDELRACAIRIQQLEKQRDGLREDVAKLKAGRDQARAALVTAVRQLAWHSGERGNNNWFRSRLLSLLALVLRPDEANRTAIKLERFERIAQGLEAPATRVDAEDDGSDDNEAFIPEGFTDARSAQPDTARTVQIAYSDGSTGAGDLAFYDAPSVEARKVWWLYPSMRRLEDGVVASWRELPKPAAGVELHRGSISGDSSGASDAPNLRATPHSGPPKEDS